MEISNTDRIKFSSYHLPPLTDGYYQAVQHIAISGKDPDSNLSGDFDSELYFYVSGERFSLTPDLVFSSYPPALSIGSHDNILPHIELTRSTLPWERSPMAGGSEDRLNPLPWLALILLDEIEFADKSLCYTEMKDENLVTIMLGLETEPGEDKEQQDKVKVLWLSADLVHSLLPSKDELWKLCHVCTAVNSKGETEERANVICNRLPRRNSTSRIHLVSLEGRFENDKFIQCSNENGMVPLVSLYNWEFSCIDNEEQEHPSGTFGGLCNTLDAGIFMHSAVKENSLTSVTDLVRLGNMPLRHKLRGGETTVSWYRSPFVPFHLNEQLLKKVLPVRHADELIFMESNTRMLDITYSAAWELGRLVVLSDPATSQKMQQWKMANALSAAHAEQVAIYSHLPFMDRGFSNDSTSALSQSLYNYFEGLHLLKGVPFNYLVPHETYLPMESIRFFEIDPIWCEAFMDGAFSIGRTSVASLKPEKEEIDRPNAAKYPIMSGVLLRSDLVSGWPALQVTGYDEIVGANETIADRPELNIQLKYNQEIIDDLERQNVHADLLGAINNFLTNTTDRKIFPVTKLSENLSVVKLYGNTWQLSDDDNLEYFIVQKDSVSDTIKIYNENNIPLLRFERIGNNVLLCLFEGVVKTLDIHLPEEAMHYGFRAREGHYEKEFTTHKIQAKLRVNRTVEINDLYNKIGDILHDEQSFKLFGAGAFGNAFIEGDPLKRFIVNKDFEIA